MKKLLLWLLVVMILTPSLSCAFADTMVDRMDAIEAELGLPVGDGPLLDRLSRAEEVMGVYVDPSLSVNDRLARLEEELGLSYDEYPYDGGAIVEPEPVDLAPLSDLEVFHRKDMKCELLSPVSQDGFGGTYTYALYPIDFMYSEIEYLLNGQYRLLRATLYVPKDTLKSLNRNQLQGARLSIYGDDKLLYAATQTNLEDAPVPLNIDLTGVRMLKVVADFDCCLAGQILVLGDPMIG